MQQEVPEAGHVPLRFATVCSGIGAPETAWTPLGWEPVFTAEIEPFPSAVLKHHHPDVPNYGDMTKYKEWPEDAKIDLICGGTPCFVAGTLVFTQKGLVPIESVQVGDMVLTHLNRWKKVLRTGVKKGDTILLKGQGSSGIETTEEHPFWGRRLDRKWVLGSKKSKVKCWEKIIGEPDWIKASHMKGLFWASPSVFPEYPMPQLKILPYEGRNVPKALDESFMWLVGAWVGDGWLRTNQRSKRPNGQMHGRTLICGDKKEEDILIGRIKACGLRYTKNYEKTVVRFTIYSKPLARWIKENFGEYCDGKGLPAWLFSASLTMRESFLEGYLYADGCVEETKNKPVDRISTVNKGLAIGVRLLANTLGKGSTIAYIVPKRKNPTIEGRIVSERPWYQVSLYRSSRSAFFKDDMAWGLVRKMKEARKNVDVHNLEVEDDNSYVADGIVVHNCQSFSVAGLRKGLADPRGNLTLVFLGVLDKYKPRWVLWENVPGVLSDETGAFDAFIEGLQELGYGVAWRILDAKNFGIPQRRRRVFVVGYLGDWRPPVAVLFEPESLSGDITSGEEEGQEAARSAADGPGERGDERSVRTYSTPAIGDIKEDDVASCMSRNTGAGGETQNPSFVAYATSDVAPTVKGTTQRFDTKSKGQGLVMARESGQGYWMEDDKTGTLDANMGTSGHANRPAIFAVPGSVAADGANTAPTVTSKWSKQSGGPAGSEMGNCVLIPKTVRALTDGAHMGGGQNGQDAYSDRIIPVMDKPVLPDDMKTANTLTSKMQGSSGWAPYNETDHLIPCPETDGAVVATHDVVGPLCADGGTENKHGPGGLTSLQHMTTGYIQPTTQKPVGALTRASSAGGTMTQQDAESGHLIPCYPIDMRNAGRDPDKKDEMNRQGCGVGDVGDPAPTVSCAHVNAVVTPDSPIVFRPQNFGDGGGGYIEAKVTNTLDSEAGSKQRHVMTVSPTITSSNDPSRATMQVRRLTPMECERLQGFPDGHTLIPWKNHPATDGNRYKALGNSMAVPVIRWIGKRIESVNAILAYV